MMKNWNSKVLGTLLVFLAAVAPVSSLRVRKKFKSLTNEQALEMLGVVEADLKGHYYDATMKSFDFDRRFDAARHEISRAKSQDEALLDIAGATSALQDLHTKFFPPVRPYGVDYGFVMEAIGDSSCYVIAVRSGSDAAAKGLKPGDQIVAENGIALTRQDINYVAYAYEVFPQSGLHLKVRSPEGNVRDMVVMAKVIPGQEIISHSDFMTWILDNHVEKDRSRYYRVEKSALVWQLPDFLLDPGDVDGLTSRAKSYQSLILDLRGNPGGSRPALIKFIGEFFNNDVTVGTLKMRKGDRAEIAKSRGKHAFSGKLIVLIDSRTSSAAEILARVVQLEKRGIVLGDRSAGAVGYAEDYIHAVKLDATNVAQYRTRVTVAGLVMSDGKNLEGNGVMPDERILPSAVDLASGRDPVLARALELTGSRVTPDEAGRILPYVWPKQKMPEID